MTHDPPRPSTEESATVSQPGVTPSGGAPGAGASGAVRSVLRGAPLDVQLKSLTPRAGGPPGDNGGGGVVQRLLGIFRSPKSIEGKAWAELTAAQHKHLGALGWDERSWNEDRAPIATQLAFDLLSFEEKDAALSLGWDKASWDKDRTVPKEKGTAARSTDELLKSIAAKGPDAELAKGELKKRFAGGAPTHRGVKDKGAAQGDGKSPADQLIANAEKCEKGAVKAQGDALAIEGACVAAAQRLYTDTVWNISTIYAHLKGMNLLDRLVHAQLVWANPAIEPVESADLKEIKQMRDRVVDGPRKLESLIVLARTSEYLTRRATKHVSKLGGTAADYVTHLESIAKASAVIVGVLSGAKVVVAGAAGVAAATGVGGKLLAAAGLCTQAAAAGASATSLATLSQSLAQATIASIVEPQSGIFSAAAVQGALAKLEKAMAAQARATDGQSSIQKKDKGGDAASKADGTWFSPGTSASVSLSGPSILKFFEVNRQAWKLEPRCNLSLVARVTDSGTASVSASLGGSLDLKIGGDSRLVRLVASASLDYTRIQDDRSFMVAARCAVGALFEDVRRAANGMGLPRGVTEWYGKLAALFRAKSDDGLAIQGSSRAGSGGAELGGAQSGRKIAGAASVGAAKHGRAMVRGQGDDAVRSDSSEFNRVASASGEIMTSPMKVGLNLGLTTQEIGGDLNWDNNGSYIDFTAGLDFQIGNLFQRAKHRDALALTEELRKVMGTIPALKAKVDKQFGEIRRQIRARGWKGKRAKALPLAIENALADAQRKGLDKPLKEAQQKVEALIKQVQNAESGDLANLTLSVNWQRYSTRPAGQSGYAVMYDRVSATMKVPRASQEDGGKAKKGKRSKRSSGGGDTRFEVTAVLSESIGQWTINYVKQRFMRDRDGGVVVVGDKHARKPHWRAFVDGNKASLEGLFANVAKEKAARVQASPDKGNNDDHWYFPSKFHALVDLSGFDAKMYKLEQLFVEELGLRKNDVLTRCVTRIQEALSKGHNGSAEMIRKEHLGELPQLEEIASGLGLPASTVSFIKTGR